MNGVQARYVGATPACSTLRGAGAGPNSQTDRRGGVEVQVSGASVAYEIPNASVGYEPGYGVVADVYPRDTSSAYSRLRVIVMTAVRHDYALIATAAGPYHEFSPDYGTAIRRRQPRGRDGHGPYVNSFKWFGDRRGAAAMSAAAGQALSSMISASATPS